MDNGEDLNNSLTTYKEQLKQIELALVECNYENNDLRQLQIDLFQLIQLTEESLKSKYIATQNEAGPNEIQSPLEDEVLKFYSEIKSDSIAISNDDDDNNFNDCFNDCYHHTNQYKKNETSIATSLNATQIEVLIDATSSNLSSDNCIQNCGENFEISGTKCRLEYGHEWGEMTQHNAVILSCEEIGGELMARVLFCNPTHNSMKPCSYYLDYMCKYEDYECKFSHGHIINMDELMPFKDPDYSLINIGSLCLCKDTDDLWYKANVVNIFEDGNVQISFIENGNLTTQELHHILPLATNCDHENYDDDSLFSVSSSNNEIDDVEIAPLYDIKTTNVFGEWEKYTTGIGSRLMAKMGYIVGQGLGRNSNGRADPIPIELLPQGKSLDKILEFREKSADGTFDIFKKGRRKFNINTLSSSTNKKESFFDFMNAKLNPKHNKERTVRINKKPNSLTSISAHDLTKKSDKHINVQLLKTADEITRIGIKLTKLNTGLERNLEKHDAIAANKIKQQIIELERYRSKLETSEKYMNQQKIARKAKKDLIVF